MSMSFPNETSKYRAARKALLASEIALRRQMEAVAEQLRALPPGREVPEDYLFDAVGEGAASTVIRMSELFRGGDTLMVYHYMFPRHSSDARAGPPSGAMANVPLTEGPCPSCTALIDMWDGTMPHFEGLGAISSSWHEPPSHASPPLRATRAGSIRDWSRRRTTRFATTTAAMVLMASQCRS